MKWRIPLNQILPTYDKDFSPFILFKRDYEQRVEESDNKESFFFSIKRKEKAVKIVELSILSEEESTTYTYVERIIKMMLWMIGGDAIGLKGSQWIKDSLKKDYQEGGKRDFDVQLFIDVFGSFSIQDSLGELDEESQKEISLKKRSEGLGLDLGGSVLKIIALKNGEKVFHKKIPWDPKINSDISYHKGVIKEALHEAKEYLDKPNFLGIGTAGVVIDKELLVSSLTREVKDKEKGKCLFKDLEEELSIPVKVRNDGEVFALSVISENRRKNILALTLGTSTGAGFVNSQSLTEDHLNELAFVPVDLSPLAITDEWSKDQGVGVSYLSQDAALKLAERTTLPLEGVTPQEKFSHLLTFLKDDNNEAQLIFKDLGIYLAYSLMLFHDFYRPEHILLGGGVTEGEHGKIIYDSCAETLMSLGELQEVEILLNPKTLSQEEAALLYL